MEISHAVHDFWQRWFLQISVFSFVAFAVFVQRFLWQPALPKNSPKPTNTNWPIIGDLCFFTERWDWWNRAVAQSSTGNFSFYIGKNTVVGVSGETGRKTFFDSKDLGFAEGYAVLFGQNPNYTGPEEEDGFTKWFHNRLLEMLKQHSLAKVLPQLLADARQTMDSIAMSAKGMCDPYDVVYKLVFLVNMRTVGCREVADDPKLLEKVLRFYETIENSTTAIGIVFPWLPTPSKIKRIYSGGRLCVVFGKIAKDRKNMEKEIDDPLQFLLNKGDGMDKIIAFVIGALFAAQLNSGMNAAWIVCYLGHWPEWRKRALDEVKAIAAKYNTDPNLSLLDQLRNIPLEAWENEFPVLDACLRDSIRLHLLGTGFRRNISNKDLRIGDELIPNGAFVTYHLGDMHQDPSLFPDPEKWNPSRHLDENAHFRKIPHAYAGWGSGRHPCLGMVFAKLELNVVLAHFVAAFDFETVEKDGSRMEVMPRVDQNGHVASKPSRPVWLKVKKRND